MFYFAVGVFLLACLAETQGGKYEYIDATALCQKTYPDTKEVQGVQLPYMCIVNCWVIDKNCRVGSFHCQDRFVGQPSVPDGYACSKYASYDDGQCRENKCKYDD